MGIKFDYKVVEAFSPQSPTAHQRQEIYNIWSDIIALDQDVVKFASTLKLYQHARDKHKNLLQSTDQRRDEIAKPGHKTSATIEMPAPAGPS